jgi:hypothetical protein
MINCNAHSDRWKMLSLAMHCTALLSRLMDLKYNRMSVEEDGQTRLFQMTLKDREDFSKFAKNIRWLITDHKVGDKDFWGGYTEFQYTDHEFRELFDPLYREKTEAVIALLEKVGNGETLSEDETKAVMEFLHLLNGRALARIDHGGCF